MRILHPPCQTIRNIRSIAVSRNPLFEITRCGNGTRIVDARCLVESRDITAPSLIETLSESVPRSRPTTAILYHLGDCARRAWVLHDNVAGTIAPACSGAIVVLHETGVGNAVRACGNANAAAGFLEHDGEDETVVD